MKNTDLIKIIFVVVLLLTLFTLVLPALFSAASNMAVLLGCGLLVALITYGAVKINNKLKGLKK